jgi:uncharacterized protein
MRIILITLISMSILGCSKTNKETNNKVVDPQYDSQSHIQHENNHKAADQGDALAQYSLALRYCIGNDVEQDYKQAFHWFSLSAEQGHDQSQAVLAALYAAGLGTERDDYKTITWFKKAAEKKNMLALRALRALQGDAHAQIIFGDFYRDQLNAPKQALKWYQKAQKNNHSDAKKRINQVKILSQLN